MFSYRTGIILGLLLASPSMGRAELRFLQPNADLGELRSGPVRQHRFEFVNDSSEPLEILDIRLGCGCLHPVLEKRVYAGGEKGTLLMHVRTLGQMNGEHTWRARVQYRQREKLHEARLVVAATLRNEVTIEPSILAMSVETTLRQEVIIRDQRPLPMKITSVLATSPAIRVTTKAQTDGITRVVLEVTRDKLMAERQEEILNIYTNDPYYQHLQVPIVLMKASQSEVNATPSQIEFRGASASSKLVRVRAANDQTVRIEKVEADHPGVKCTWASGPGNDATVKISIDAQQAASPHGPSNVHIRLTEPSARTMTIPVVLRPE